MALISVVLGAFLGLYINHIFTWKIKDKIDIIDEMGKTITELDHLLLKVKVLEEENSIKECKHLFMKMLFIQRPLLKDILTIKAEETFESIKDLYNGIKWNRKPTSYNGAGEELLMNLNFQDFQETLYNDIIKARTKITSFKYIMKSFCQWQTLVVFLLVIIFWLSHNCLDITPQIVKVVWFN